MSVELYYMIRAGSANFPFNINVHHVLIFIAYIYVCINPFIYAVKFDPVKRILVRSSITVLDSSSASIGYRSQHYSLLRVLLHGIRPNASWLV